METCGMIACLEQTAAAGHKTDSVIIDNDGNVMDAVLVRYFQQILAFFYNCQTVDTIDNYVARFVLILKLRLFQRRFPNIQVIRDKNHTKKGLTGKVCRIFPVKTESRDYYIKKIKHGIEFRKNASWLSQYFNVITSSKYFIFCCCFSQITEIFL